MELTAPRYRLAIHRAHGCYFARVLELPGCVARGATEVEAVESARVAIRAYLRIAKVLESEKPMVQVVITA